MKHPFFIFSIFFLVSCSLSGFYLHPFHVSKSDVKYNEKAKTLEIAIHIFIDDLEFTVKKQNNEKLYLATPKESANANSIISSYIFNNFSVNLNGKPTKLNFIGKEYSEDKLAVWCYFEATDIEQFKEIVIKNTILLDMYEDQKNIVHVLGPNNQKAHFLHQKGREIESKIF